jgi:hypothetical protein
LKIVLALSMLTALLAVAARAADPAPAAAPVEGGPTATVPPCEPPEAVVPKRNLAFDQSEEEYPVEPYGVGPPAMGMEGAPVTSFVPKDVPLYVAVLNLQFRFPPTQRDQPTGAMTAEVARFIQQIQGPQSELLRLLVNQTPQERLPSREILFELTQNADLFVRSTVMYGGGPFGDPDASANAPRVSLHILAPTPQRAKEYAVAVLTLYDYGLSYPIYCGIQQMPAHYATSLAAGRKELAAAKATLARSEEELNPLKSYEDITPQSIGSLVSQQRMVEVDLAGIKARIEACNKLLAERSMPVSRSEQVETVKISAEIDLVGLAARKEAIERLVTNGRRRIDLEAKSGRAASEVARWQHEVDQAAFPTEAAKIARDEKLPFAQVQAKVLVRRVKWVEPSRMGMPGRGGMGGIPGSMPGMMAAPGARAMPGRMPGVTTPRRATSSPQPKAPSQPSQTPKASDKPVPSSKEPTPTP